ncbi:TPA: autotransporter outer membrane beta-barrel domain-containing protein [Salmonella enterica subsp. salamae]|nr:autotransporter outer membrane beta-barrel domain-containing protein [Salmonella enterica subsp. salamae]
MNKIFSIIWNDVLQKYVVTSELAKGKGKPRCNRRHIFLPLLLGLLFPPLPTLAGETIDWYGEGQSGDWSLQPDPYLWNEVSLYPDGTLSDNTVNIYSNVGGNVYGAFNAEDNSGVNNNQVNIYSGNIKRHVAGGATLHGNASANNVTLFDGKAYDITGGTVYESGNTLDNTVTLNGGNVTSSVFGGDTVSGNASGNTVIFSGGTVNGHIYGGRSEKGNAENNTVILQAGADPSDINWIYGGYVKSGYTSSNNTLYVQGFNGTVGGIAYVQNLEFDADAAPEMQDTILSMSTMDFKNVNNIIINNIDYSNYTDHQINDVLIHGSREFADYDASKINITVTDSGVDYLGAEVVAQTNNGSSDLILKYGLRWYLSASQAMGTFTLANAEDNFTVQESLNDVAATDTWDGKTLTKAGSGTLTLATANRYSGGTIISDGTLIAKDIQALGSGDISNSGTLELDAGDFVLSQDLTTHSGGVTQLGETSTLHTGTLTQESGSELNVYLNLPSTTPQITAAQVNLAGALNIVGITGTPEAASMTLIDADTAINGNFDTLTIAGMEADNVDFLTVGGGVNAEDNTHYDLSFGLSWYADSYDSLTPSTGTFTLADAQQSFTVSTVLQDVAPEPAEEWDGKTLTKKGAGTLILDAKNTYSGTTSVDEGTLWLTNNGVIGLEGSQQQVNVATAATLGGGGTVNGNVSNAGTLSFGDSAITDSTLTINGDLSNSGNIVSSGATPGNTLNVSGNYVGNNGTLTLNTQLDGDTSPTDELNITGDASGNTTLYVNNVGGQGALTEEGIKVVDIGGRSTDDAFTQGNRLNIGAYEYRLYQDPQNNDWYLRSEGTSDDDGGNDGGDDTPVQYRPDIGAYLGNQWMARSLQMQTLYDRQGSQYHSEDGSMWARFQAGHAESNAADGNISIDNNYSQFQIGGDILNCMHEAQSITVGVMGSYINADTDSTGNEGADGSHFSANGNVKGYNMGLYATWFADAKTHQGWYIDSWYQYGTFDNSVDNGELGSSSYDARASTISLESGYRHDIGLSTGNTLSLTPQAQVTWQNYHADSFTDNSGTEIDGQNSDTWTSRLGLRIDGKLHKGENIIQPFVEINWLHTNDDTAVSFDDEEITQSLPNERAELKAGIQADISDQWSVRAQASGQKGSDHYSDLNGSLSVHYRW